MSGEPVAIVGVGAVYPGAGTAAAFWRNIRAGLDATGEVPPHRWDPALYYDPDAYDRAPESDRFYCRRGGFIDDLATFDPARFGIMPGSVAGMEPDQLLALRTAAEAIGDAGGEDRLPDRSRIGVVIGRGGYLTPGVARFDQRVSAAHQLTGVLAELLPDLDEQRLAHIREAFRARLGSGEGSGGLVPSFAASRIANRFDLRGPAYTLDAACASSLLAVEHAVRALRSGQCEAMLAGAVHHAHHATVWSVFSQLRALSPSERIRPFDRAADGTLLSEGTGMVLLKRLSDAERDGDRVHAVIRGVGSSSDGRAAGLMSPLVDGQVLAVERAWQDAGLDPSARSAVGLVEAHGTATPAGDDAELATLRRAFGLDGDGPPVGLGTVKSMIGHAMPAAGLAGLIKAACALRDGVLPPTLNIEEPHPALTGTRLRPVRESASWERPRDAPRRAVVNAFGFGGANAHVVLEEPPSAADVPLPPPPPRADQGELVLRLAAPSAEELAAALAAPDDELAASCTPIEQAPPQDGAYRLAIVDPTPRKLALARTVVARGTPWRGRGDIWFTPRPMLAGGGKVAFLFPGFEPTFEPRVDDIADHFGLPRPDLTGRTDLIGHAADVAATGRVLADALARLRIEADMAAGHSLGEWTAMVATGMYPPGAAAAFMSELDAEPLPVPDAVYAALGCGADRAMEIIAGRPGVYVSHDNCPHQSVICGPPGPVREVLDGLAAEGVLGGELPFRSGFHTPMATAYMGQVRRSFETLPISEPDVPLWSATTVAPFPTHPAEVRELVVRHLLEPVRFSELVEELHAAGARAFLQIGPGGLPGFVGDRLGDRDHLAMSLNVPRHSGMAQLRRVVAALWAEGYGAPAPREDVGEGRTAMRLDLGTPLVRLDGAVPPLATGGPSDDPADDHGWPELPGDDPVMAELDALLREATAGAQSVVDALGAAPSRPGAAAGPELTELTATRTFSLESMPYLADHCILQQPAGWPDMSDRFPVVPLATLIEVMAETARELLPDLAAVGFEDVRALRWVPACPATTADIRAHLLDDGVDTGVRRVRVAIQGHADGTVLLAARHPEPPATTGRPPLEGEAPPPVTAHRFYSERWMFHGPLFQGVREIHAMARDGLRALLTALPTPGALIDSAGQLCGHWMQVHGDRDRTVFPVGIGRVLLYGPQPPIGTALEADVRHRSTTGTTVRYDVDLYRDGALWGRIEGWETRRFFTDDASWRMKFTPEVSGVADREDGENGGWCAARPHWDGNPARDLMMRQYLRAAERAEYEAVPPRERGAWLLGRIAAKDAVRHHLWDRGHGPLFPAELTVRDEAGTTTVTGPFDTGLAVSVATSGELGVALARPVPEPAGIALEPLDGTGGLGGGCGLDEAERRLLDPDGDRAAGEARLRAAKAAASRAFGGRDGAVVTASGPGLLEVAVAGTLARVAARDLDGHVVAWTTTTSNDEEQEQR